MDFYENNGYLLEDKIISDNDCNYILKIIEKLSNYKNVNLVETFEDLNRKHIILTYDKNIERVIMTLYNRYKNIIHKFINKPELVECSCFLTYPNSKSQKWHRDFFQEIYITIGVALNDIEDNMGPLEVLPKSDKKVDISFKLPNLSNSKKLSCKKGSVILWNSKILHRGPSNDSENRRFMFILAFREKESIIAKDYPFGLDVKYKKLNSLFIK